MQTDHSAALAHYTRQAQLAQAARSDSGHVRAAWLIESAQKAHTAADGSVKWHLVATEHEATIRALAARVNVAEGTGVLPASGCHLTEMDLGPLTVTVEYEHEPAEGDGWNEPRLSERFAILRVYLNGYWCDAQEVVPEATLERWEASLYEGAEA